ncbi:hypothetical protein R6H00_09180 [Actinotignum timonense]|uniref:hypothetical protein n=1 Tax=Actinotignum timonense TaxID=1870995 RepID=UPI002A81708A|nr:hypothetical protein [Actinotignum timonense]MDY5139339.1 hypothetical protein [Actinotignum timonense]
MFHDGPEAGSDSRENRNDLQDAIAALRAHYYTRILTLAGWDLTLPDPAARMPEVAATLSNLACATLEGALQLARTRVPDAHDVDFTIIALGKTGGGELNYASDVDVVYITEPRPGVSEARALEIGTALATTLAGYISAPGPESALWTIDTALRPEGGTGPLVRTLASHLDYYATWAQSWEFQALLKARVAAGNRELGANYTNASCSGARTSDIAEQVSAVTPATSVVFLTAGGNDANFAQIISSCFVLRTPKSCEEAMNTATAALPAIEEATLGILRSIDTASHGQATAILVGYPRLFAERSYLIPPIVESYDAGAALAQLQDAADAMQERVIAQMRKETGSERFLFASTQALFAGHEPRAHAFRGSEDSDDSEEAWLVSPFTSTDIRAWT